MALPELYDMTKSKRGNFTRVDMFDVTVWFSYGTMIAFRYRGLLRVRRNDWGPTTGRHINSIVGDDVRRRLDPEEFEAAWAEVERQIRGK